MSNEIKVVRKNDFSLVSESQLNDVLMNLIYQLTKNEDHSLTKDILKFNQDRLEKSIDRLDIKKNNTTFLDLYSRYIYIPVNEGAMNTSSTKIEISFVTSSSKYLFTTFIIPPNFSNNVVIEPVAVIVNRDARDIIPEIIVNYIEVTRDSTHGVKEFYFMVDLQIDGLVLAGSQSIEVTNELGNTKVYSNILFNEDVGTVHVNNVKTSKLYTSPVIGFDDIPERDKLVRSSTITDYEIISRDAYQLLETNGNISATTVYSIPEDYQKPNPDSDRIFSIKTTGVSSEVDLSLILKSCSKIKFNGDIVESIPLGTAGLIELYDAVALDEYTIENTFGNITGVTEISGTLDAVNTYNADYMFHDMPQLKLIVLHDIDNEVFRSVQYMFSRIPNVEYLDLTNIRLDNTYEFDNFISTTGNIASKLGTILLNNLILPIMEDDENRFDRMFVNLTNLVDVYLLNVDTYTISKVCIGINNARTTSESNKIRVHVDSANLVVGLNFENIEFVY